jgi:hypothetical protein
MNCRRYLAQLILKEKIVVYFIASSQHPEGNVCDTACINFSAKPKLSGPYKIAGLLWTQQNEISQADYMI